MQPGPHLLVARRSDSLSEDAGSSPAEVTKMNTKLCDHKLEKYGSDKKCVLCGKIFRVAKKGGALYGK